MAAVAAFTVGCAIDANQAHADGVFRSLCPADYLVVNVVPACKRTVPFCRWVVKYSPQLNGQVQNAPGGVQARAAFQLLKVFKPLNVNVTDMYRSDPDHYVLEYGVNFGPHSCMCVNLDFDSASTTSKSSDG